MNKKQESIIIMYVVLQECSSIPKN